MLKKTDSETTTKAALNKGKDETIKASSKTNEKQTKTNSLINKWPCKKKKVGDCQVSIKTKQANPKHINKERTRLPETL